MERDFEYEREKPRRKKGGALGKILMMFVGIVLGIAITVGSVVGVGYWAYNQPVGETVEKIDGAANTDIYDVLFGEDGILNASYADKKVQDLVRDVLSELNNVTDSSGTLQGLCQLSPKLDSLLTDLVNKAGDNYALDLDKNTLVNTSFSGLAGYFESALRSTALGDLLVSVGEDLSPLLCALCYGEEDVDYTLVNGKVEMIPPAQKTTLNDLFNVGADSDLFSRIPLATLFDNLDTNDSMMMSVLYGAENRYTVTTEEGKTKVKMNQVRYIKRDDGFYDDTDTRLDLQSTGTSDNGTTLLVFTDGTIEYARLNGDEALVYKDSDCTKPLYYKKMTVGDLQGDLMGTIETIYVKDALKVDASSPSVMIALAYGTEGEDYEIVSGKIQMINGKKPRTIGDLTKDSDDLINSIALKDALNITKDSPSVMIALAYGTEGVDYKLVNDKFVMLDGKKPRTIGDLTGDNSDDLINSIALKDALNITKDSPSVMIALAYGTEGVDYDVVGEEIVMKDGKTPRTLGDLTGTNSETVINSITLKDALNITKNSHSVMIALAYGTEGVDYDVIGEEIVMKDGKTPRTLGDLTGTNSDDLINGITLRDALDINASSHKVLIALACGNNYTINGEKVESNELRTIGDLINNSNDLINGITLKDALDITPSSHKILISLAYGTEGRDYKIVEGKFEMLGTSQPRTLKDLSTNSEELINGITLKDALNITKDSHKILIALAYGNNYTIHEDGSITTGEELRTLGSLINDSETVINGITLKDALDITPSSHKILISLAYGSDYTIENGVISGGTHRTIGDLTGSNGADLINEIKLKDALDITPSSHKILIAIAYGNDYHIDINGNLTGSTIRSIGDLTGDNSETVINDITLKDALDITPSSHKILISLAYGSGYTIENGVISGGTPRTLGNLIENGEDLINEIALSDLISDDGSTLIRYLLYGKQGVHFDVVEGNVTMLQRRVAVLGNSVYNEYGEKLNGYTATATTFTDDKDVTYHLVSSALGTVKTSDGEATLYYVTDANNQDVLYKANTLGDLIKDNSIISNLTKRLTLLDVLGESVNDNKFLKHIQNVVIDDLPNAINDLAIQDVFADDIFNADGTLKGTWKYLLTNSTHCDLNGKDCTCDKPKYKLTEIDQLVTNMQQNVKASSLNTLKADGILTFDNDFLGQDIIKTVTIMTIEHTVYNTTKTKIGELTVEEMVEYAQALMQVLSNVS